MLSVNNLHSSLNRRKGERRHSPALAAFYWNGSQRRQAGVCDISSTGAYILTDDRWPQGASLELTLQRIGARTSPENGITVAAKAVRQGKEGIGLSFVLPEGMDIRLWQSPLKDSSDQNEPEDVLREFRIAAALVFLHRICPSVNGDASHLLREGLSNYRVENAIEIAFKAEKMLAAEDLSNGSFDDPYLFLRLLEDGSWSDSDVSQQLWAGLLASSCGGDASNESNLAYIEIMSQMTASHFRLFVASCKKAQKFHAGSGQVIAEPFVCTSEELIKIAGVHDLIKIDRDLLHLAELGLLEPRYRPSYFSVLDDTTIRPTNLGLELFARCNGHRGSMPIFYNFVPPAVEFAVAAQ